MESHVKSKHQHPSRRTLLKVLGACMGAGAAYGGLSRGRRVWAADNQEPYFLIVLPAFGGGAIIDSFLPVKESEATDAPTLDCFPDAQVKDIAGSPFRAVDAIIDSVIGQSIPPIEVPLSWFADKYKDQMMVTTLQGTSVNHNVAQHRSLTGGGAWAGRTLQEMVALCYGEGYPLPNVNMATLGYLSPGADRSLPDYCYAEPIAQPLLKPLSLSAYKGINGLPDPQLIEMARAARNGHLDAESSFYRTFRLSERLQRWRKQRSQDQLAIESQNLIDKLIFVRDQPGIPLSEYGLQESPDAAMLATVFPNMLGAELDPLEHQAALAYLLLKNRVSVTVTLAPTLAPLLGGPTLVKNPPLAFDGSHNDHRSAQALMWSRILTIADKLIDLLKATPYDEGTGESMWDRTMLHMPTDFGRDKRRPAGANRWGTAHNLNNGTLTLGSMVNGNRVLGDVIRGDSVDTDCHTYGFNLTTGAPEPGRTTTEMEHYAGLLQALAIDTAPAGLPDVPAMRRQ